MCDSHADWNHAHVLYALRQLFRELVRRETHHDAEDKVDSNSNSNIEAAKPEKKALHIPTGALDLLFQWGKFNPFLDCRQTFPMNHPSAVVLHPLPESHVTGQDTYKRHEFHRMFSFHLFILAGKAAGCNTRRTFVATQSGAQEY
jgi:hypothetical protein